jgi:sulfate adenylyltransferase subunit 2
MDSVAQSFLSEIERYLASAGVDPSALGKQALGDPNFVFDLRKGRSPSTRTIDKVRGWIAQQASPDMAPRTIHRAAGKELTHLERLEAESIHIIREVAAECEKPVMLYSIGKDSAVMLRLAQKAFHPGRLPFPLLHVDTTWKFREMITFRDRVAREIGAELIVHVNQEGLARGINPFSAGSRVHTDVMKTQALKQALDLHRFDAAFGGARRDEEKSRAKERVFSFRNAQHRWDPKNQRPEPWRLYNTRKKPGESIRVFPLSNWTELDVWTYIQQDNIPVVPLYFAAPRPVVEREGALIMVDDARMPLLPGEVPQLRTVRFRTLGCYPLTGAIESEAATLTAIIQEMLLATTSERQGRVIDFDSSGSMEKKKQEGYF